jgi:hypothetical protein
VGNFQHYKPEYFWSKISSDNRTLIQDVLANHLTPSLKEEAWAQFFPFIEEFVRAKCKFCSGPVTSNTFGGRDPFKDKDLTKNGFSPFFQWSKPDDRILVELRGSGVSALRAGSKMEELMPAFANLTVHQGCGSLTCMMKLKDVMLNPPLTSDVSMGLFTLCSAGSVFALWGPAAKGSTLNLIHLDGKCVFILVPARFFSASTTIPASIDAWHSLIKTIFQEQNEVVGFVPMCNSQYKVAVDIDGGLLPIILSIEGCRSFMYAEAGVEVETPEWTTAATTFTGVPGIQKFEDVFRFTTKVRSQIIQSSQANNYEMK